MLNVTVETCGDAPFVVRNFPTVTWLQNDGPCVSFETRMHCRNHVFVFLDDAQQFCNKLRVLIGMYTRFIQESKQNTRNFFEECRGLPANKNNTDSMLAYLAKASSKEIEYQKMIDKFTTLFDECNRPLAILSPANPDAISVMGKWDFHLTGFEKS